MGGEVSRHKRVSDVLIGVAPWVTFAEGGVVDDGMGKKEGELREWSGSDDKNVHDRCVYNCGTTRARRSRQSAQPDLYNASSIHSFSSALTAMLRKSTLISCLHNMTHCNLLVVIRMQWTV